MAILVGLRKTPRKALLIVPLLLLVAIGLSCSSESASLEEQAQGIDSLLMCPVCPAETIDQSQAEIALQMRAIIRQKLEAGEGKPEILDFFVDRYGKSILAKPPQEGFNLLVWIMPPIAVVVGLVLFWVAVRHLGRKPTTDAGVSIEMEELTPFLYEVEQEYLAFERVYPGRSTGRHKDKKTPAQGDES